MTGSELTVVLISVPSAAHADRLMRVLLEERLAACVSIIPAVQSHYWWEGKIEHAEELLLVVKTVDARLPDLEAGVKRHHPYDTPEIVALGVTRVFEPYLTWARGETSPRGI